MLKPSLGFHCYQYNSLQVQEGVHRQCKYGRLPMSLLAGNVLPQQVE